jgi:PAS domain S-box-containing protein
MVDKGPQRRRKSSPKSPAKSSASITPIENTGLAESMKHGGEVYQLMIDAVRDYAIFLLDPNGYVASWNRGAKRIKGYEADEIIGRHFSTFYRESDIARGHPQHELEIATADGRFEEEGWRVRKDGSMFWANVVITAVRDKDNVLVGFAKVTRDLTERREAEQVALANARRAAAAEAANTAKTQFLTAMSHELRTPLNAIGGYTELLSLGLGGPITSEQTNYLERIHRSQKHLTSIISDLLNFSRIEAGRLTYDIGPIRLVEAIDEIVAIVDKQAESKGIAVVVNRPHASCTALGDRVKVDQILLNLLSNAIKFNAAGGKIVVHCDIDPKMASIVVRDTGAGIPRDKLEEIFEPFVQIGRTLTSAHQGTGLGLSISRDLARAMHGNLTVESTPGEGSTFTLTLPRPLTEESEVIGPG